METMERDFRYVECATCKRLITCSVKSEKAERCVNYEERIRDNGRAQNVCKNDNR